MVNPRVRGWGYFNTLKHNPFQANFELYFSNARNISALEIEISAIIIYVALSLRSTSIKDVQIDVFSSFFFNFRWLKNNLFIFNLMLN